MPLLPTSILSGTSLSGILDPDDYWGYGYGSGPYKDPPTDISHPTSPPVELPPNIPAEAEFGDFWDAIGGPAARSMLSASEVEMVREAAKNGIMPRGTGTFGAALRAFPLVVPAWAAADRISNSYGRDAQKAVEALFGQNTSDWLPGYKPGPNIHESMKNFAQAYYGRGGWRNNLRSSTDGALAGISGAFAGLTGGASDYWLQMAHSPEHAARLGIQDDPLGFKAAGQSLQETDITDRILNDLSADDNLLERIN